MAGEPEDRNAMEFSSGLIFRAAENMTYLVGLNGQELVRCQTLPVVDHNDRHLNTLSEDSHAKTFPIQPP